MGNKSICKYINLIIIVDSRYNNFLTIRNSSTSICTFAFTFMTHYWVSIITEKTINILCCLNYRLMFVNLKTIELNFCLTSLHGVKLLRGINSLHRPRIYVYPSAHSQTPLHFDPVSIWEHWLLDSQFSPYNDSVN